MKLTQLICIRPITNSPPKLHQNLLFSLNPTTRCGSTHEPTQHYLLQPRPRRSNTELFGPPRPSEKSPYLPWPRRANPSTPSRRGEGRGAERGLPRLRGERARRCTRRRRHQITGEWVVSSGGRRPETSQIGVCFRCNKKDA